MAGFNNTVIPKLPGMQISDPIMSTRNRSQTLVYKNGFAFPREDLNGGRIMAATGQHVSGIQPIEQHMNALRSTGTLNVGQASATLSEPPTWLSFDRQVLRFYAYFKESVTDSATENQRVRRCVIYYYLEDGSIYVAEPAVSNSGLAQGVFLKRHRMPGLTFTDIAVGQPLTLYSRVFYVTGADPFTRSFFSQAGIELAPDEGTPDGPHETMTATLKGARKTNGPPKCRTDPFMRFTEAKLGKASNALTEVDTLGQFLENDGKVLRFYCLWDTRKTARDGERRLYVLNYYLADDCVEVLETKDPAGGRDPWARMLRKGKLPTVPLSADALGPTKSYKHHTWADLKVGGHIVVHGRDFLLYDADPFTKAWYQRQGVDQTNVVDVAENKPPRVRAALPPYNGYGLLADSAQNCVSLLPKPPKADFHKLMDNDKKVMRFKARMVEHPSVPRLTQADLDRSFVLSFFLADDTLSVFEPSGRNSGFPGGKFLERGIVTKDGHPTGERYAGTDFCVGATIRVYNRLFNCFEADGFTLTHMEGLPQLFPESDLDTVLAHVRGSLDTEAFKSLLEASGASLTLADLKDILTASGASVSVQQALTIARQWSSDGSAPIPTADLHSLVFPEEQ